jgi:hypothetical protein
MIEGLQFEMLIEELSGFNLIELIEGKEICSSTGQA